MKAGVKDCVVCQLSRPDLLAGDLYSLEYRGLWVVMCWEHAVVLEVLQTLPELQRSRVAERWLR